MPEENEEGYVTRTRGRVKRREKSVKTFLIRWPGTSSVGDEWLNQSLADDKNPHLPKQGRKWIRAEQIASAEALRWKQLIMVKKQEGQDG